VESIKGSLHSGVAIGVDLPDMELMMKHGLKKLNVNRLFQPMFHQAMDVTCATFLFVKLEIMSIVLLSFQNEFPAVGKQS